MQDLIAGQIDFGLESAVTSLPQFRAGNIRALAVAGKSRLESAIEIPTVDEAGMPGLYMTAWFAFFAPKGTPKDYAEAHKMDASREVSPFYLAETSLGRVHPFEGREFLSKGIPQ